MRCSLGYPPGIQGYMAAMDQMEHFGTDKVEEREFRKVSAYFQAHYHSLLSCGHDLEVCILSYPPAPAPQVECAQVNRRQSTPSVTRCRRADRDPAGGNNALRRLAGSHLSLLFAGGLSAKMFSDWLADAGEGLMTQQISKRALLSPQEEMDRKTPNGGGLSEIDFLRNVVPLLSRLLVGKTQRENIWDKMYKPKDWPQRLTWKNPTSRHKDSLEELQEKLKELRSLISLEMLSPFQEMLKLYDENKYEDLHIFQNLNNFVEKIKKVNTGICFSSSDSPEVIRKKREVIIKLRQMITSLENSITPAKRKCPLVKRKCPPAKRKCPSKDKSKEFHKIPIYDTTFQNISQAPQPFKVLDMHSAHRVYALNNTELLVQISANSRGHSFPPPVNENSDLGCSQNSTEMFNSTIKPICKPLLLHTDFQPSRTDTERQPSMPDTDRQQHMPEAPDSHQSRDSGIWSNNPADINDGEIHIKPASLWSPDVTDDLDQIVAMCRSRPQQNMGSNPGHTFKLF